MKQCCNTCGFLLCNKERNGPPGQDWYGDANIERLWHEGLKYGRFLICHSTDPHADTYGGVAKPELGQRMACLGAITLVFMHIKIYEWAKSYDKYRDIVGDYIAMTRDGLLKSATAFTIHAIDTSRSMAIPLGSNEKRTLRMPVGFEKVKKTYDRLMQRPVIGYQIESADGRHYIPEEFYSYQVFTEAAADNWLMHHNNEDGESWIKVPVHEGDIEEPTFISSIRDNNDSSSD